MLGRLRQQDRELLAAGARDRVAGAAVALEDRADAHERLVAGAVPEPVVDGLEVVEVADHDAERLVGTQRALDLGGQLLVEREPVVEARERVGVRRLGEAAHELRDPVAHHAQQRRRPGTACPRA